MKKIFTFIAAMLCVSAQALADKVVASTVLPDAGKPEHVYSMKNANGVFANALTAPTQTEANYGLFAFYPVEGKTGAYYIYSTKAAKWLTYTAASSYNNGKDFIKMSATKGADDYFKVNNFAEDFYDIQPYTKSGGNDKYVNWYQGVDGNPLDGSNTLGLWQDAGSRDGGSKWTFTEVVLVVRNYTITMPEGYTITIGEQTLKNGDTYTIEGSVKKSDITVVAPEGQFAAVAINDVAQTITVYFANIPAQPATVAYTNAVVYPAQQEAVGAAVLTEDNGVYTLSNNVLAASFVKLGDAIYFGGSNAMDLVAGTEIFSVAFGNGDNVPASGMTLKSVEVQNLEANPSAIGGAEHFAGKQLVANYSYTYKETTVDLIWRAVLRDGSHYLRTEMELLGVNDIDMYNVIPLMYNVDTKAAGSAPKTVGNTRGAVLMSNKIFAGLEHPVAYNTAGEVAGDEDNWNLATTLGPVSLTADSWTEMAEADVPGRVTEATGAGYPDILEYKQSGIELKKNQKVEVLIKYTSGSHRLNLGGVDLLDANGSVAANDYHSGFTGGQHSNNTFTFTVPYDGVFTIRAMIEKKSESVNANSTITAKIYTPKEGVVVNTDIVGIQGLWSRNTTLQKGETWKIAGVVGLIAQDGTQAETNIHKTQKRRSFLAYSERERAVPWRAYPAYISWYELNINRNNAAPGQEHTNMQAEQVVDIIKQWQDKFYNRYGEGPAAFIIDDGWDNYGTWTFHKAFPNEMRDIAAEASVMGAGVGAWLGPVGGYGQSGNYRRNYWSDKGGMQLSNPAYYQVFKDAAYNLVKNQGDYSFFKFDGISAQFSATGPDAGDTGNENAEGIIRLERYVREELREDIFFNTTVGTWASPFWYQFTDATWRQENDYGEIGNHSIDRERWITYRDRLVYQNYVTNSPICPINTLMTHGFILSSFGSVSKDMSYDAVLRELRCAFVCGSGLVELYNDYALMNSINNGKLWSDLAECIAWQKRNADVLPDIHWVGGNPWDGSKTSVYGWASWNGKKATLALRNGTAKVATYEFTLREALNIPANVTGSIILRNAFSEQERIGGLTLGEPIDIDTKITAKLLKNSVYCFDGIMANEPVQQIQSITLEAENGEARVDVKKNLVIKATVNPATATYPVLAWESSDEQIATVSNGFVKGLKEGQVTITAKAQDGSDVSAQITITVGAEVREPYATNFDKNTNPVGTDRYITTITLTEEGGAEQVIEINEAKPYLDKSADEACVLSCKPGKELTAVINKQGNWMNAYVYIDLDGDQQFSFNDGTTDQTGTEVMSFSFYTGSFENDTDNGVNSAGESLTGGSRNTMTLPPFKAPAEEGTYRIRFKMDWNSVDPGGQVAADGTCTGANGFLANRGSIVDATLIVNATTGIEGVVANGKKAELFDLSGRKLNTVPAKGVYIQNGKKVVR